MSKNEEIVPHADESKAEHTGKPIDARITCPSEEEEPYGEGDGTEH